MDLKKFTNQKGFIDLVNTTNRTEIIEQMYDEVYPTKIGFEALLPFEQVREKNQMITVKKPLNFVVTTGEKMGEEYELNKKKIFNEYSEAEYIEKYISIDKAFKIARIYSPIETLTPKLIASDLIQAAQAETQYKRKAMLDTALEAPKLYLESLNIRKDALKIHDMIVDHCYEMGINISDIWIFAEIDFVRGIRDELKLIVGATKQIQDVLDGAGVNIDGIMSSIEGINYVGLPKKVSVLDPDGKADQAMSLLPEGVAIYVIEMNSQYHPFKCMEWVHTPLSCDKAGKGTGYGNKDILEYAMGYDVKIIEHRKLFAVMKGNKPTSSSSHLNQQNENSA